MIKINKAGYLYILLTILIGFSAVNTANNLVYIITSGLLSYMLVSGFFGRANIRGIEAQLEFPEETFAGIDTPVMVKLANRRKRMPAFLIGIELYGREVFFPFAEPMSSTGRHITMRFDRRGLHRVGTHTVTSTFPFNFFTRYRRVSSEKALVVYPKPVRCGVPGIYDFRSRTLGDRPSDASGYDSDLISIRDYVPGDHPRYISWKSTAKTGVLMTKELSTIELRHLIIDFDQLPKKDLEHTISCVAYTVLRMIRSGTPVGMTIGGRTYPPDNSSAQKTLLLTRLALYGQDQDAA